VRPVAGAAVSTFFTAGTLIVLVLALGAGVLALLVGGAIFALVRAAMRLALPGREPPPAPLAPPAAGPGAPELWQRAREQFDDVRAEYAAYECDPVRVLNLPALADVSVASTARFVDAFAEAQGLETDTYPGPEHGPRFVTAAEHAVRTWKAARDAAARIRLTGLGPAERATVERVLKLLATARDSDSEPERLAAYSRARSELAKLDRAGVVHVPLPARAALDEAARGQLPAAEQ
jgi:hypothetical protein